MANAQNSRRGMSFRVQLVYRITAGMAGTNYMIFTSVDSYVAFDQSMLPGSGCRGGHSQRRYQSKRMK